MRINCPRCERDLSNIDAWQEVLVGLNCVLNLVDLLTGLRDFRYTLCQVSVTVGMRGS